MRLIAVLRPEADQHDLAGAMLHRDRRGLPRDSFLTEQPAALQDVTLDERRQDLDVLARERRRDFVRLAPGLEAG